MASLAPLHPHWLGRRAKKGLEDAGRRHERLGKPIISRPNGRLIWCHGASMGEGMLALSIAKKLLASGAFDNALITTGTNTSAQTIKKAIDGDPQWRTRIIHQYVPLDRLSYARAFLSHWQPDLAIFVEGEIWPNLLRALDERGIKRALLNARMTASSAKQWARFSKSARHLFGRFCYVQAADKGTGQVLEGLIGQEIGQEEDMGLSPKMGAVGNLKLALPVGVGSQKNIAGLEEIIGQRPVWLAASTHSGEDDIILASHDALKEAMPDVLLILAPRHPQRFEEVAQSLSAWGFSFVRCSRGQLPSADASVFYWDTIGELGQAFPYAHTSFVCGSLKPKIGGHNPIEPIMAGSAVLTGPYVHNFADIYRNLVDAGAAIIVQPDHGQMAISLAALLSDRAKANEMAQKGQEICVQSRHHFDGVIDELLAFAPVLEIAQGADHASA